jgi:PST family polysaccharide transporter
MAVILYMRIDIVMLKFMQGDRAVGIYATAARISEVWYFVPTAIISSVSPAIIRVKDDPQLFQARIERLFTAMSLMSLCVGAVIALGAPWIVRTLYTNSFSAAAPVLAVHVWTSVFVFLGVAQSPWDLSRDLLKLGFYRTLAGAVANILLNLVLIPRYSVMGAAFATVISQAIASVFANAVSVRTRPVFFLQIRSICLLDLWRPLGRA